MIKNTVLNLIPQGYGLGSFAQNYPLIADHATLASRPLHTHMDFVEIAHDLGAPGLFLVAVILLTAMAQRPHPILASELGAQCGDLRVAQPLPLGPAQQRLVEHRGRDDLGSQVDQAGDLVDEPGVDAASRLGHLGDGGAEAQRELHGVEPPVVRDAERLEGRVLAGTRGVGTGPEAGPRGLHRAQHLVEGAGEVASQ